MACSALAMGRRSDCKSAVILRRFFGDSSPTQAPPVVKKRLSLTKNWKTSGLDLLTLVLILLTCLSLKGSSTKRTPASSSSSSNARKSRQAGSHQRAKVVHLCTKSGSGQGQQHTTKQTSWTAKVGESAVLVHKNGPRRRQQRKKK